MYLIGGRLFMKLDEIVHFYFQGNLWFLQMQAGMAYGQPYNQQAFTGVQVRPLHNNHIKGKQQIIAVQRKFYIDI